jgi:hypothetical protein
MDHIKTVENAGDEIVASVNEPKLDIGLKLTLREGPDQPEKFVSVERMRDMYISDPQAFGELVWIMAVILYPSKDTKEWPNIKIDWLGHTFHLDKPNWDWLSVAPPSNPQK